MAKKVPCCLVEDEQLYYAVLSVIEEIGLEFPSAVMKKEQFKWLHIEHGRLNGNRVDRGIPVVNARDVSIPEFIRCAREEVAKPKEPEIFVGSNKVEFADRGGIQVGCAYLSYGTIKKIYDFATTKHEESLQYD